MPEPFQILIVEDDPQEADLLSQELADNGYKILWAEDGEKALQLIKQSLPDLVLLDILLPNMDGFEVVKQIKDNAKTHIIPVIMVTALADMDERVKGLDSGADDYITKPFKTFELLARVRSMLRIRKMYLDLTSTRTKLKESKAENSLLKKEIQGKYSFENMIGASPAIKKAFYLMEKAIESPLSVLIQGETGTGKELVARSIHYNSTRKDKPFIAQNCAALPETLLESELFGHKRGAFTGAVADKKGLFETAHKGTIFLDEVGDTPLSLQVRLLRVLQEGEIRRLGEVNPIKVDVRVIAATHQDLKAEIEAGRFREDLYYRIQTFPIPLPPLRDRGGDIPLLAEYFLRKYCQRLGKECRFSPESISLLEKYPFPGNIRELENEIARALTLAPDQESITPDLFSEAIRYAADAPVHKQGTVQAVTDQMERSLVQKALEEFKGNRTRAAEKLGLSRRGLLNKIRRFGLE
ncbi:MAG: sigma-54-dependent Fis family transcriptional regulator [Deltaproteobacteria bacterium]|nr:sigma-54-dependent Fis family transcriptional regulator [Deltaproteobacteria bacterium]